MAGIYERDQTLKVAATGDTIFVAQSDKVPFSRLLRRGKKPPQMLCDWPVKVHPDRKFTGALDGTDMTTFNHTNRDKLEAYAMWMRTEGWMVSRLANVTKTHGVKGKEEAEQAAEDALILAQMIEKQLLSADDTAVESGVTPYCSRGAFSWLSTSAQTTKPVPASYRPASGCAYTSAIASFVPSSMETMLAAAAGQKKARVDLDGFGGLTLKTTMSSWAQRHVEDVNTAQALQKYNIDANDKKLMRVVDFFEFDAGDVRMFTSFYMAFTSSTGASSSYSASGGIFVDMKMWELCFLDEPAAYLEPPKSGGPRGYHDAVYILKCWNPAGQCCVYTAT